MMFQVRLAQFEIEEGVHADLIVAGDADVARSSGTRYDPAWTEIDVDIKSVEVRNQHACPLPPAEVGKLCAQDRFLRAVEREIEKEL